MSIKQIIVYDEEDNIITVLTSKKDINAFIHGYLSYSNQDHYTVEY